MRLIILTTCMAMLISSCGESKKSIENENLDLSKAMAGSNNEGFERATEIREFSFPEDHGPHPGFRTEWWYFTGNLSSGNDRNFGYQFTIFRTALTGKKQDRTSPWNSNQIYMAHFALTDIENDEFYFDERFSREGNKLAGAEAEPFRVWLEDWEIRGIKEKTAYELPVINLKADLQNAAVDFNIEASKPMVLQGEKGLSQKGSEPGNASYYYSYTRLKTEGRININGEDFDVSGYSWMDREWSTSALDSGQAGWDWFSLQLNDNTEIMYYQLRRSDGTPDIFSKGVVVDQTGNSEIVEMNQVNLSTTDTWKSASGSVYPSGWKLQIPDRQIELNVLPQVKKQLMDVTVKYWEGSVKISGVKNGKNVEGYGYVELTGY